MSDHPNMNRERGLKAALHNPRVSEQAKQRDREILQTEFGEHFEESTGYMKPSALSASTEVAEMRSSIEVSDEDIYIESEPRGAKKISGLRSAGAEPSSSSAEMMQGSSTRFKKTRSSSAGAQVELEGKETGNVIRGLKAALSNPHVSEKAKEKDRKKLRELGEAVE